MTQTPKIFCIKCKTTRPPLLSGRNYTCVICGLTRSVEEFRVELAKLKREAEKEARGPVPYTPTKFAPSTFKPPAPEPKPPRKPVARVKPPAPKPAPPKPAVQTAPVRVPEAPEKVELIPEGLTKCAWKDCDKPARPKSKYCSRACSNKNARWRHAQRRTD